MSARSCRARSASVGTGDQSGFDALRRARALVVGEEEHLALLDRPAERAAGLLLLELRALGRKVVPLVERGVADKVEAAAMEDDRCPTW